MSDENNLQSTVNAVKGVLDSVPVYQDVVQPAAKEVGQALQTVAKTIHILLAPVSGLVWGYEQIKEFVSTRVAERLQDVPPERLTTPEPNIAGPALESLRYTGHNKDLRELYAALLATAMDSGTMHQAHPSFVEIIRQLSSDEALMLHELVKTMEAPMIDIRNESINPSIGGHWVLKHFSFLPYISGCTQPELGNVYLVNLQRLGLVELRENYQIYPKGGLDPYREIEDHPIVKAISTEITATPERKPVIGRGVAYLTPMGVQFARACIN